MSLTEKRGCVVTGVVKVIKQKIAGFCSFEDAILTLYLINKDWHDAIGLSKNTIIWKKLLYNKLLTLTVLNNNENSLLYENYGKCDWYKDLTHYDSNTGMLICENTDKKNGKFLFNREILCGIGEECCKFFHIKRVCDDREIFDMPIVYNPYYSQLKTHKFYEKSRNSRSYFEVFEKHAYFSVFFESKNDMNVRSTDSDIITWFNKLYIYVSKLISKIENFEKPNNKSNNINNNNNTDNSNNNNDNNKNNGCTQATKLKNVFGRLFSVFNYFNVLKQFHFDSLYPSNIGKNRHINVRYFVRELMFKFLLCEFGNRLAKCDEIINGQNYVMADDNDIENGLSFHGFMMRLLHQNDTILCDKAHAYDIRYYKPDYVVSPRNNRSEMKDENDLSYEIIHYRTMVKRVLFNEEYNWHRIVGIWRNHLILSMYIFNHDIWTKNTHNRRLFTCYVGINNLCLRYNRLSSVSHGIGSFINGRMHHKTMALLDYLLCLKKFAKYNNNNNKNNVILAPNIREYSKLLFNSETNFDSTRNELNEDGLLYSINGKLNIDRRLHYKPFMCFGLTCDVYIKGNKSRVRPVFKQMAKEKELAKIESAISRPQKQQISL